ncbi:MAG: carboxymuconolactone decarboxylase family protein [Planctomycetes bacterium]|nr:carboxymuconolactone decarboxylase family protein [Planctomycetota bacterium]
MPKLPKPFTEFVKLYPQVAEAYERMGAAAHAAGPLDPKSRALIKLAISVGARLEGAVHSHARKALAVGCSPEELAHVAILSLPTLGLPSMMAARTWIEDVLATAREEKSRRK